MGPCLCGDPYCPSCGPAQGNCRCYQCGAWSADGGCEDPDACAQADRDMAEAMAKEWEWEREHADEIERALREENYGNQRQEDRRD